MQSSAAGEFVSRFSPGLPGDNIRLLTVEEGESLLDAGASLQIEGPKLILLNCTLISLDKSFCDLSSGFLR
jgi:hypothetical protein